jgi:hypothetical protein
MVTLGFIAVGAAEISLALRFEEQYLAHLA